MTWSRAPEVRFKAAKLSGLVDDLLPQFVPDTTEAT